MVEKNESQSVTEKQLCTITVNAVVDTDEQAIMYKKRVSDAFADNAEVQINFSLHNAPRPR